MTMWVLILSSLQWDDEANTQIKVGYDEAPRKV